MLERYSCILSLCSPTLAFWRAIRFTRRRITISNLHFTLTISPLCAIRTHKTCRTCHMYTRSWCCYPIRRWSCLCPEISHAASKSSQDNLRQMELHSCKNSPFSKLASLYIRTATWLILLSISFSRAWTNGVARTDDEIVKSVQSKAVSFMMAEGTYVSRKEKTLLACHELILDHS